MSNRDDFGDYIIDHFHTDPDYNEKIDDYLGSWAEMMIHGSYKMGVYLKNIDSGLHLTDMIDKIKTYYELDLDVNYDCELFQNVRFLNKFYEDNNLGESNFYEYLLDVFISLVEELYYPF
jgi:hypothetical protein